MCKSLISILSVLMLYTTMSAQVIIPKPIKPGSKIALVTPASMVKDEIVDSAAERIRALGYEPVIFPHAKSHDFGSYPAEDITRAIDLMSAFVNPEIDAILCTRGGYGTVRLLPLLNLDVIRDNPKWMIGYSDISNLHALMHKAGVASIHGPMAKHLAVEPDTLEATNYLFDALTNKFPMEWHFPAETYNNSGIAKGRLVGGNLICINDLSETPYDILNIGNEEPIILFIEDIGEKIYAIERILQRLHLAGILRNLQGLVIGQFTEYRPSDDYETMYDMIYSWLSKWGYYETEMPIVFNFPTGHVSDNFPMIVSAETELIVTPEGTTFRYTGK